jgi:hypothetical protein
MAQDYFLRLIEQVAQMLAAIVASRKAGRKSDAVEQIAAACQNNVGIPLEIVRRSSPGTLLQLLEPGGALRHIRAVILAELLMQDSEILEDDGKSGEALIARAQAYALLSDALPHLPTKEQSIYRKKMEILRVGNVDKAPI